MKLSLATLTLGISLACQVPAFAQQNSTTPNLLMTTVTFAANSNLGENGSTPSNVADGTTSTVFTFGDAYKGNPNPGLLSLSGFSAPSGIDSLVFYDYPTYGQRTASSVTIYTSTANTAGSLNTSDYTLLGTFALPTGANQTGFTEGTDAASSSGFDVLSGLGIAAGTQSLLFGLPDTNPQYGTALTEIQAFPAPEPSSWQCMIVLLAAAGGYGLVRRRQANSGKSC